MPPPWRRIRWTSWLGKGLHKAWYTIEKDVLKVVESEYLCVEAVVAQSQAANSHHPKALNEPKFV